MTPNSRVTIVFDNTPGKDGLVGLWGFAAIVEIADLTILVDTGSNGRVLLKNMSRLGYTPGAVDILFLTHPHWDHIGGVDSFLELNTKATIVLHQEFSKHLVADLRATHSGKVITVGTDPLPLSPGIFSTGIFDSQHAEHALIIDSGRDTAVISGCAHPGMERIVAHAANYLGKKINWAMGGFHLMDSPLSAISETVDKLKEIGVSGVVPTHCSGKQAEDRLKRAYGKRCINGGAGCVLTLGAENQTE